MKTNVEPHTYTTLSLLDRLTRNRCRHCYWPGRAHPVHFWAIARPYHDRQRTDERAAADIEFAAKS